MFIDYDFIKYYYLAGGTSVILPVMTERICSNLVPYFEEQSAVILGIALLPVEMQKHFIIMLLLIIYT